MFGQVSIKKNAKYNDLGMLHAENDVAAALTAARDAERDRAYQRDFQHLAAELATVKSTAKWNLRIAEDRIEAQWRDKTDVLITELTRLRKNETDMKLQLSSRDAKIRRLRKHVTTLERIIEDMLVGQNERTPNESSYKAAGVDRSVTNIGDGVSRKSSKYSVMSSDHGRIDKNSYSKLYQKRQRNVSEANRESASEDSKPTKPDSSHFMKPRYDINGRRVF